MTAEPEVVTETVEVVPPDRLTELDAREEELADKETELAEWESELDEREAAVSQTEEQVAANTISADGVYVVGDEIEPGTYRSNGTGDLCYWARLSGLSGELDDIIANHAGSAKTTVEIQSGDVAFETTGCGEWTKIT